LIDIALDLISGHSERPLRGADLSYDFGLANRSPFPEKEATGVTHNGRSFLAGQKNHPQASLFTWFQGLTK